MRGRSQFILQAIKPWIAQIVKAIVQIGDEQPLTNRVTPAFNITIVRLYVPIVAIVSGYLGLFPFISTLSSQGE